MFFSDRFRTVEALAAMIAILEPAIMTDLIWKRLQSKAPSPAVREVAPAEGT